MTRRKNSSIATVRDTSQHSPTKFDAIGEDQILKPVLQNQHPDDWPCFLIEDAVVFSKDCNSHGNLLNAELDGPFTIQGSLQLREDQAHLLIHDTYSSPIKVSVSNVIGFSIADDPITIWASGSSGWFEIKAARSYQSVYGKMAEGVDLYYFLVDIYEENRETKKSTGVGRQLSVDWILSKYSQHGKLPISKSEAIKRCVDHATFLFSQMRKGGTHVNWSRTTMFQWLKEVCPDVYQRYEPSTISPQSSATRGRKPRELPIMITPGALLASQEHTTSPFKTDPAVTECIFNMMKDLHERKILCRQHMTVSKLSKALYTHFELANEAVAEELLIYHAEPLLALLERNWSTCSIYRKIRESLLEPRPQPVDLRNIAATKLVPLNRQSATSILALQETSDLRKDLNSNQPRRRKRRLEETEGDDFRPNDQLSWRNADSTYSKEPPSESENKTATMKTSKSVSSTSQSPRRHSRSGKCASLRLAQRYPANEDSRPRSSGKRQRRLSSPAVEEELDSLNIDENPYSEYKDADYADEFAPEAKLEELELLTEALPSLTPQGPEGLWICNRDGCRYEVPGADKPDGKVKVQDHFLEHADEIEAREQLVIQECRPHLPIDNLLEKIRNMGQAARLADERVIGGRVVPLPVHRRLPL